MKQLSEQKHKERNKHSVNKKPEHTGEQVDTRFPGWLEKLYNGWHEAN